MGVLLKNNFQDNDNKQNKVKLALLSMQRENWEQGVAMQAFLELGDNEMVYQMAQDAVLHQADDGRLAVGYFDVWSVNHAGVGEGVMFAGRLYNDEKLIIAAEKMLNYFMTIIPKSESGVMYHLTNSTVIWVDSLYFAPPFMAFSGKYEEAIKQIKGHRDVLWDAEKKLYSHMWDDQSKAFVNKNFWGVGNGWAAAGMTRVIRSLPESMAIEKKELIRHLTDLINGCLAYLRPDGLFHNDIDQPGTFIETNLSQMIAYSIYRGVKYGWFDERYLEYAHKMRKAAHDKVSQYGFVEGVCGAPLFKTPGRAAEGQAFFLLMEAAYNDYV